MRLSVLLSPERPVVLPWNYLYLLSSYLYRIVGQSNRRVGSLLHDSGFGEGPHRYKLFVFSWLYPRQAWARAQGLGMQGPIRWYVSSPLGPLVDLLARALLREQFVAIGAARLPIARVEVEPPPPLQGRVLLETLSPLVASTGEARDGKLHKVFLDPRQPEFWRVVQANLARKARVMWGREITSAVTFEGTASSWHSRLVRVGAYDVRGFEGRFWAEGDPALLALGYESGFGERNAQGFGMVRVVPTSPATAAPDARRKSGPEKPT